MQTVLHLAEKVNVEKLPGGRLLGGRVGQGLHLHRLWSMHTQGEDRSWARVWKYWEVSYREI
jgi:hypothetical protein